MGKQIIAQKPKNLRELRPYLRNVRKINQLEAEYEKYSDDQLKNKTIEFKERLQNGETIDGLAVEAFATVREVSKRVLGMRHFDVQLLAGLVLLNHNVSEINTGEEKKHFASLTRHIIKLAEKVERYQNLN